MSLKKEDNCSSFQPKNVNNFERMYNKSDISLQINSIKGIDIDHLKPKDKK